MKQNRKQYNPDFKVRGCHGSTKGEETIAELAIRFRHPQPNSIRLQLFSKCSFNPMSVIGYDVG